MASVNTTYSSSSEQADGSGYRLKFRAQEFLDLVAQAKPKRIYKVNKFFFFNFDGFTMYCEEVSENELPVGRIFHAIEFSNYQWKKT